MVQKVEMSRAPQGQLHNALRKMLHLRLALVLWCVVVFSLGVSNAQIGDKDATTSNVIEDLLLEPEHKIVRGKHGIFVVNKYDTYVGRSLLRYYKVTCTCWLGVCCCYIFSSWLDKSLD